MVPLEFIHDIFTVYHGYFDALLVNYLEFLDKQIERNFKSKK